MARHDAVTALWEAICDFGVDSLTEQIPPSRETVDSALRRFAVAVAEAVQDEARIRAAKVAASAPVDSAIYHLNPEAIVDRLLGDATKEREA